MTTVLDILIAARALIEREECWTQRVSARTAAGDRIAAVSDRAVCWCVIGAVFRAHDRHPGAGDMPASWAIGALDAAAGCDVDDWNDAPTRTHAEVLDLFDRAIERAREAA